MKTSKRVLAVFSAACIAASMSVPAFAADAEPLSEYAGETAVCQVVLDSGESYMVDVPIAADATEAEERAQCDAAVFASAGESRSMRAGPFIELSYKENLHGLNCITGAGENYVGGGTLKETYLTLTVVFDTLRGGNYASKVDVRLVNEDTGVDDTKQINLTTPVDYVYFLYGKNSDVSLVKNQTVSVYAQTDRGYAEADSCTVNVSPYEYDA